MLPLLATVVASNLVYVLDRDTMGQITLRELKSSLFCCQTDDCKDFERDESLALTGVENNYCSVRHFDLQALLGIETLRPLVAPSLRSGCHSPGPSGFLNPVEPLVSVSDYYIAL